MFLVATSIAFHHFASAKTCERFGLELRNVKSREITLHLTQVVVNAQPNLSSSFLILICPSRRIFIVTNSIIIFFISCCQRPRVSFTLCSWVRPDLSLTSIFWTRGSFHKLCWYLIASTIAAEILALKRNTYRPGLTLQKWRRCVNTALTHIYSYAKESNTKTVYPLINTFPLIHCVVHNRNNTKEQGPR